MMRIIGMEISQRREGSFFFRLVDSLGIRCVFIDGDHAGSHRVRGGESCAEKAFGRFGIACRTQREIECVSFPSPPPDRGTSRFFAQLLIPLGHLQADLDAGFAFLAELVHLRAEPLSKIMATLSGGGEVVSDEGELGS